MATNIEPGDQFTISIADWQRYEVNSHGHPAKNGEELRAGPLDYVRLKVRGHTIGRGFLKLQKVAKGRTWEVIGIFDRLLDLAANGSRDFRGVIREQRDGRPATIDELAEILPAKVTQINFALQCLSHPTVSWITLEKQAFPGTSGNSGDSGDSGMLLKHNTTQHKSTEHNPTQGFRETPETPGGRQGQYSSILNCWNEFKGQSVCKGTPPKTIVWHSHSKLIPAITAAIDENLPANTLEDVCGAITNYAKVLLGSDYKWTYVWNLPDFLTVKYERGKDAQRKWWQFIPSNFVEERYLTPEARSRQERKIQGPTARDRMLDNLKKERITTNENPES